MDFKNFSDTALAVRLAQAAGRQNGSTTITALELARSRVAKCESDLTAAREQMRAAADKAGLKRGGLFAESLFVSRARAEEWCDQARAEGADERTKVIIKALQAAANPDSKYAAARAWGKEMLRRRRAAGIPDDAAMTLDQWHALTRGEGVDADPDAEVKGRAADLAAQILAAGVRARSSGEHERPEPTGLSGKIIAAGKARRVPFGDENK